MTTISSATLSLLQSLNSDSSSQSLSSTLYGGSTTTSADPVAALVAAERNETKDIARQAKDPQTKRDVDHFTAALVSESPPPHSGAVLS